MPCNAILCFIICIAQSCVDFTPYWNKNTLQNLKTLGTCLKRLQPAFTVSYNKAQQLFSNCTFKQGSWQQDFTYEGPITIKHELTACLNIVRNIIQHDMMFMFHLGCEEKGPEFDNWRFCLMGRFMKMYFYSST